MSHRTSPTSPQRPLGRTTTGLRWLSGAVLAFLGFAADLPGQIIKWDNGGADLLWGTAANWSNNTVPTTSTALTFDNTYVGTDQTIGLGNTNRTTGTLTFSSALNYTFNNGTNRLQLSTAGTNFTQSGAGNVVFNSAIYFTNGLTFAGSGAGTVTLNGSLSDNAGTDSLTKNGTFTLVLNGANNTQDGTIINAGTVEFGSNAASSNGLALNGGTIRAGSGARSIANPLTVGGNFSVGGSNDLTLSGTVGLGAATRTVTVDNTGTTTFSGVVSSGGLTKAGNGTLVLSGTNTYASATTLNAGTLKISADAHLGTAPAAPTAGQLAFDGGTLETTATLSLSANRGIALGTAGGTLLTAGGTTLTTNALVAGSGALTKAGNGTLVLGGANTYTGPTNLTAGSLQLGANNSLPSTSALTVASGATFDVNGKTDTIGSLAGAGTVTLGAGALTAGADNTSTTFSGVLSGTGTLTKSGTGTLTLSGSSANTSSGTTTVAAGTLQLGKTGAVNAVGGNAVTIGDGVGAAGSAHLTLLAYQQIPDTAAVTINSDGRFLLNNFSEKIDTVSGLGLIDLSTSGFLTVGTHNGSSTFGGTISGTGTLIKEGSGSLTFTSAINFGGQLTLAGGTLALNATTLTVGTLRITGNSILDFGNSTASVLNATTFVIDAGVTLTITNWANGVDYFFATNWTGATANVRGAAPMNQVAFTGFSAASTGWQSYDQQITPVPEPSTYGALLIAFAGAVTLWRRSRSRPTAAA
jgi:autotransporter-associated beta strand protein